MVKNSSMRGFFSEYGHIETVTYKDQAYQLIKEAILYQKFQAGVTYSQEFLCQELGISRTPVREALLELQKEGYVQFFRGKGIQVVSLDQDSIQDILEVRLYLEQISAVLAAKRASIEDVASIRECLDQQQHNPDSENIDFCYRLDHQFHRAIAKATHNKHLFQMLNSTLDHYLRFEMLSIYNNVKDASAILNEHSEIYDAISTHNEEKAGEMAKMHLRNAYHRTLSQYWKE